MARSWSDRSRRARARWDTERASGRAGVQFLFTAVTRRLSAAERASRRTRAAFYRELWTAAAAGRGLRARPLAGSGMEIGTDTAKIVVDKTPRDLESAQATTLAADKLAAYRLLENAGLPVPAHAAFSLSDLAAARSFLAAAQGPCVVKPARDTSGGSGVTTGVTTTAFLRRSAIGAAAAGARMSESARSRSRIRRVRDRLASVREVPLLIEEQVPGANYRLLYLDGELIDAIRRSAPTVVGDGVATIDELIRRSNERRVRDGDRIGVTIVTDDADLHVTLAAQGLGIRSVPGDGVAVALKTAINEGLPQDNWPARAELCDEIIEEGLRAVMALRVRLAGVDVITSEPGVPLGESGGCILEVNTDPGLSMHCHGHPGQIQPADVLLSRLLELPRCDSADPQVLGSADLRVDGSVDRVEGSRATAG